MIYVLHVSIMISVFYSLMHGHNFYINSRTLILFQYFSIYDFVHKAYFFFCIWCLLFCKSYKAVVIKARDFFFTCLPLLTSVTFFIASYKFSGGNHHILFYHFFSNLLDYSIKTLNVESKARPSTATPPLESCLLTASENSSSIAALLGDLMTYNGRVLSGAFLFLPIIMNTKSLSLL